MTLVEFIILSPPPHLIIILQHLRGKPHKTTVGQFNWKYTAAELGEREEIRKKMLKSILHFVKNFYLRL